MSSEKENKKQPYNKPRLVKVDLTMDEVLAANCKTDGGPMALGQPYCGLSVPCAMDGS
jgi:hypothetical protein